ncbi:Ger(x)C family spore germination protein [Paenibacillus glycanilyticus]|uniref:Ger(x)C family spore germination protein n=1 Tax=Paenibacillus glycanilyticus TaxID=126569 RepID=UPI00203B4221|nr:Ger(x)C family spore germination protein [Paenibacillus glycanilyticus]MCM3629103.1 Ger(x)C family spore germination protein [Paenibacillus glycanilyticus]
MCQGYNHKNIAVRIGNSLKNFVRFSLLCLCCMSLAGCSPDVNEISDIALVTATAIDYNADTKKYTFSAFCVMPSNTSQEKSSTLTPWISSASGKTPLDAARKMRSRVGKNLIFQHNKFFIISESAAKLSLYEVMDYLTRKREFRISAYPIIAPGQASDILKLSTESGDMLPNDLLGQVRNNKLSGQIKPLTIKDFVDLFENPNRGFVSGRLKVKSSETSDKKILFLNGGAVIYKQKFAGWLEGNDVWTLNALSGKKYWRNIEFNEVINSNDGLEFSALFHVKESKIQGNIQNGSPRLSIYLKFSASVEDLNEETDVGDSGVTLQMERAASNYLEKSVEKSLKHFQKDLKIDVLGLSDYYLQYHPAAWKLIEKDWESLYPMIPVKVHVAVQFEKYGMSTSIKERL